MRQRICLRCKSRMLGLKQLVFLLTMVTIASGIILCYFYTTYIALDIEKLPKRQFPPVKSPFMCENIMTNLTNGRWIRWEIFVNNNNSKEYKTMEFAEKRFDEHMAEFRIERGIHTRLWRDDLKCGSQSTAMKPANNAVRMNIGAWCDAKSDRPCCSDDTIGNCGFECDCERCIDMRKIVHAEFAKWSPYDARCQWKNYTGAEACKVIRKFSEIHILGDSYVRKMGRVMILMLRSDRNFGVTYKKHSEKMRKKCVSDDQLYWTECRLESGTFKQLLVDESPLCGMDLSRFVLHPHYKNDAGKKALKLAKTLVGKPGTLILLSVGVHLSCNAARTFKANIQPMVQFLNSYESTLNNYVPPKNETTQKSTIRWPLVIFMFPDTPGLLKSPDHMADNGKVPCYKFTDQMIEYLTHVGIPYLDFRKLTTDVHSYDGGHYGIGVNVQKLQILLNYLESRDLFNDS